MVFIDHNHRVEFNLLLFSNFNKNLLKCIMDRWNIKMPTILSGSISILSDAGLGMAMFSLGIDFLSP